MDETEIKLHEFYREHALTELRLSHTGFTRLMKERGRKVCRAKGNRRMLIRLDEKEICIAATVRPRLTARLFCFRCEPSVEKLDCVTLQHDSFFHLLEHKSSPEGVAVASFFLSTWKNEVCVVLSDYDGPRVNLTFLRSVTRHYFQSQLLFVPEAFLNHLSSECSFSLPCLDASPFLC